MHNYVQCFEITEDYPLKKNKSGFLVVLHALTETAFIHRNTKGYADQ